VIFFAKLAMLLDSGEEKLVALAAIGAAIGVYWFYKGFRMLQRKRLILNTPSSKVRSASMGLVEINGLAIGPYVILSPLKQAECYYYRSMAWQLKQEGKNSEWVKVADEALHVPFYIDDGTGRVLVDPRGAEMDLHCDLKEQYHTSFFGRSGMPGSVAEFLARHGVNPDKKIKVEEYCIKPKNFLFVLGTLSQNPGLDASIRPAWAEPAQSSNGGRAIRPLAVDTVVIPEPVKSEPAGQEVVRLTPASSDSVPVTAMTQQQKIAAALMKAGISNPAAWAAAGVGVKPQTPIVRQVPEAVAPAQIPAAASPRMAGTTISPPAAEENDIYLDAAFDLHPPVVLMQGTHSPAFFISWRSQREVVVSLGWKSALMIWCGPMVTLGCVYFLLAHFGWL
jgi:E3 Ubiquitin ligase